jgi:transketolase
MTAAAADLETRGINVIRGLTLDAVRAASSGHTGTAMALAPLAHVLWTRVMRYDAADPRWPDRDRFVLSAGHASMLLYSMLHLTGFGLSLDEIRRFRQWGSSTPGHPEMGHTAGVEVTTGPLGQGIGNAVGMALAERHLRSRFGSDVFDHRTFAICSDGDLMEGVSHEVASFAGHQRLGRLVAVYDDNHITIDGPTELALSDDAAGRFRAYGWHVVELGEVADDLDAIERGVRAAMTVEDAPSLVVLRSHIGNGLPTKHDTADAHGAITDDDEVDGAKAALGLPVDQRFWVPDEVAAMYARAGQRGRSEREAWEKRLADWDGPRADLEAALAASGLNGWREHLPVFAAGSSTATRQAANATFDALVDVVPGLITGGADLTGNTGTKLDAPVMTPEEPAGRRLYFGVREHGMGTIANGMAAHGGVLPAVGTFLVFSDYMRGAVRLAAVSGLKVVYVWSHDSVGVGEDGPTHQPIEHVAALRAMPGLDVIRPADATETAGAVAAAIDHDGPTALILTRQGVPSLEGTDASAVARGGYVVTDADGAPEVVLVGTGSELQHCVAAAEQLRAGGTAVRVVSLPCWERFARLTDDERSAVLPAGVPAVGVEAGTSFGWHRWVDATVSIERFGASAPGGTVMSELGMTAGHVVETARRLLAGEGA